MMRIIGASLPTTIWVNVVLVEQWCMLQWVNIYLRDDMLLIVATNLCCLRQSRVVA